MRSLNFFTKTLEHPILAIGILMMSALLFDLHRRGILDDRADKLKPYPCRAAIIMLVKRAPSEWKIECKENNLLVTIPFTPDPQINMKDDRVARMIHLRELANQLHYLALNTGNEQISRTTAFAVLLESDRMAIQATGTGKDLSLMAEKITPDEITAHLMRFQVKEKLK